MSWGSRRLCLPYSTRLRTSTLKLFLYDSVLLGFGQLGAVGFKEIPGVLHWERGFSQFAAVVPWYLRFCFLVGVCHYALSFTTLSVFSQ